MDKPARRQAATAYKIASMKNSANGFTMKTFIEYSGDYADQREKYDAS